MRSCYLPDLFLIVKVTKRKYQPSEYILSQSVKHIGLIFLFTCTHLWIKQPCIFVKIYPAIMACGYMICAYLVGFFNELSEFYLRVADDARVWCAAAHVFVAEIIYYQSVEFRRNIFTYELDSEFMGQFLRLFESLSVASGDIEIISGHIKAFFCQQQSGGSAVHSAAQSEQHFVLILLFLHGRRPHRLQDRNLQERHNISHVSGRNHIWRSLLPCLPERNSVPLQAAILPDYL